MSSLVASDKGGGRDFDICPAGSFAARCVQIIDLGHQPPHPKSKFPKESWQVRLVFELPTEIRPATDEYPESPWLVGKDFTVSLDSRSNLRKLLEAWRGCEFTAQQLEAFDIANVLGAPGMLTVVHATKEGGGSYPKVDAMAKLPKGMTVPEQITPRLLFELKAFDQQAFDEFPSWLQDKIKVSPEYKSIQKGGYPASTPEAAGEPLQDDIPF